MTIVFCLFEIFYSFQQCIIPMQSKLAENADDGLIKIRSKKSQKIEGESTPKVAKITLNDCLACSGCITSAESILIDQQDYHEAQRVLQLNQSLDTNVCLTLSLISSILFVFRILIEN